MFEKRRYHPIAILIYLIAGFKKWLPLLIVSYISEGLTENWWGNLFFFGVVLSLSLQALLRYFFEYYQLFEEKIVIYKGIFQKKEIDIPYERIQTIKERQWFFFKPFQIIPSYSLKRRLQEPKKPKWICLLFLKQSSNKSNLIAINISQKMFWIKKVVEQ